MRLNIYRYFYHPTKIHKLISMLLLPISMLYLAIASIKRVMPRIIYGKRGRDFGIPIISVGNLIAGGSGKTPFTIALAQALAASTTSIVIISRGYKRKSLGLVWVSIKGVLQVDVTKAGDEPYLMASALASYGVSVLVCENRTQAIIAAKHQGATLIILDDGFRFCFKKLDIVLRPLHEPYYPYPMPSGLYRESYTLYARKKAHRIIAQEGCDFIRHVSITNPSEKMLLLTGIAHPQRLEHFLPQALARIDADISRTYTMAHIIGRHFFPDHHNFTYKELEGLITTYKPLSILTTEKDASKLEAIFTHASMDMPLRDMPLSIMKLRITLSQTLLQAIYEYIKECRHCKDVA